MMRWLFSPEALLSVLALCFVGVALSPLTEQIKSRSTAAPQREVLSVVRARFPAVLTADGASNIFQAVKVATENGLAIEIFENRAGLPPSLVNRFDLPRQTDGFFHIQDEPANMAFVDQDGDGTPELLVSSYSSRLEPQLNVFVYDPASKKFQPSLPSP